VSGAAMGSRTGMGIETPWGRAQATAIVGEGIWTHTTASHGGYELSLARWAELEREIPSFQSWAGCGWLEEDCDWVAAAALWPELFAPRVVHYAVQSCKDRRAHDIPESFWEGRGKKAADIAQAYARSPEGMKETSAA
jgi:hypothetical protein